MRLKRATTIQITIVLSRAESPTLTTTVVEQIGPESLSQVILLLREYRRSSNYSPRKGAEAHHPNDNLTLRTEVTLVLTYYYVR